MGTIVNRVFGDHKMIVKNEVVAISPVLNAVLVMFRS